MNKKFQKVLAFFVCVVVVLGAVSAFAESVIFNVTKNLAEEGNAISQYLLGDMYDFGKEGVEQDSVEAFKWYKKSAEQGYPPAQFMTGVMYSNGWGVIQDKSEAVKWWRKAAEQGVAQAQFNLGAMYGNIQDYSEANKWLRMAARQGHTRAQEFLKSIGETW